MRDMTEVMEIIEKEIGFEDPTPATEKSIEEAERRLNVKFPESYKIFLSRVGVGNLGACIIFGILRNDIYIDGEPNVVWKTERDRGLYDLPQNLIIIYHDGGEFGFYLDTSKMKEGECPVAMVESYFIESRVIEYECFADFLYNEIYLNEINNEFDDEEE